MDPVAYLVHTFPLFSTTFINEEVDEMRRQGSRLFLFAVQRPAEGAFPPEFRRFRDETVYVFPAPPLAMVRRHLACLASRPGAYLGCLAWILSRRGLGARDRLRTLFHFAEAVHLYPEIRRRGCGHLHVHFLFGGASIAVFLKRLYGLPYSLTAHGSDIFVERVLQGEKLREARFTRVATEFNARELRPLLPAHRRDSLHVIPFGIGRGAAAERTAAPAGGTVRILAVGRLIWQKAHHLLLEALARLALRGRDFHLRLVGDGPLREAIEERVRELGLEGRVTLAGALPRSEVWREYDRADLFVLSSVSEGSPFVILEAMACGLPVIAPALHGIPEMIRDGEDGRLFRTGSVNALEEALEELVGDATLRQRLGIGAETSAAQLDPRLSVERFRTLILAAQSEGTPGAPREPAQEGSHR